MKKIETNQLSEDCVKKDGYLVVKPKRRNTRIQYESETFERNDR